MSNDTILTDDYVADFMAKEASEASIKYSSMGLEAFKSTKPANKAKPNTRFLGRIIKETTNHNAALLAREAAEAQARLDHLTEAEERKRRKLNPTAVDIRRRQLGDISSILTGRKRKLGEAQENKSGSQGASAAANKDEPSEKARRRRNDKDEEDRTEDRNRERRPTTHHRDDDRRTREARRNRERSRSPDYRPRKHRHRSPLSVNDGDSVRHHKSHNRRPGKDREEPGGDSREREKSRHIRYGRLAGDDDSAGTKSADLIPGKAQGHARHRRRDDEESDPLDDLIGPAPPSQCPVRLRGRGAARGAAVMDGRFSDGYDPNSDVQPDAEEADDWEEAVEVFRDRQKWKQQGADRLRAAGFTDEQVKKWEKGGQKDIDDVRWSKAGERREWDKGKDEEMGDA
ncbi:hypothetical protein B0H67DRAFT_551121 [Lasiosphaeris hirsuta]|uniref:Pre-mRNA-splicing factor 38B n=1 Tax=Lasiosphaeris hirsuta TaxID=260670 RepID=A0AA40B0X6_9PEZI|nr:hypothetical protein B0H67DRAFT_551121 [Lasiosphaeris hirsuta]